MSGRQLEGEEKDEVCEFMGLDTDAHNVYELDGGGYHIIGKEAEEELERLWSEIEK